MERMINDNQAIKNKTAIKTPTKFVHIYLIKCGTFYIEIYTLYCSNEKIYNK